MPSSGTHSAYAAAGVDYDVLDSVKRLAQAAAARTAVHLAARGCVEVAASRGESAYVVDLGSFYLATLTEGLGTKNLVADAVRPLTGRTHYDQVAQDAVATILNDLATTGAVPLTVSAYWGTGSSQWFADEARAADLIQGWERACVAAGAAWGGGETQTLQGIIASETIDLAGAAAGLIRPKERLLSGERLAPGDAILIAPSTGIHANGLTLARQLAGSLPQGYATPVPGDPDGFCYGEALLRPSPLYGPLLEALQDSGVAVHYAAHITGHGWRKLMRADRALTYVVDDVPPVPPVLTFLAEQLRLSPAEAYGTFNMGGGFAFFVPAAEAGHAQAIAAASGWSLLSAGVVEPGVQRVVLRPLGITYEAEGLQVRHHAHA